MADGMIDIAFRGRLGSFALDMAALLPPRGVTALFGPSGSGKTSVLRCMAGLTRLPDSHCRIDGEVWQDGGVFRPPHRRASGYVFQEPSLFPHLDVMGNLLFGAPKSAVAHRIGLDEVVELLGLSLLLNRATRHLSGGERQRVAIGRALMSQPRLLLMDEPLAALDQSSRDEILPFLERLNATLALPMLYVSHDMAEVERLADHLVLMENGRVRAQGPLSALQGDPALPLIAARAAAVSLDATVTGYDPAYGLATLAVPGGAFLVPAPPLGIGTARRLRVLAADVSLTRTQPEASTISNILPARILSVTETGPQERTIGLGLGANGDGARLLARVTRRSFDLLGLEVGQTIEAQIKAVALVSGSHGA